MERLNIQTFSGFFGVQRLIKPRIEECNEDESIAEDDDVDVGGREEENKITRTNSSKFANFSG